MTLPPSPILDIEALSRLFDRTTNSYKYLFFLGLMDELRQRQFDAAMLIPLKDVVVEMLARAWRAHHTHQLKFGVTRPDYREAERVGRCPAETPISRQRCQCD